MSFIIDIPSELGDKNLAGFFTGWTWHDDPESPVILRIERGTHIAPWAVTLFGAYAIWLKEVRGKDVELHYDEHSYIGMFIEQMGLPNLVGQKPKAINNGDNRIFPITRISESKQIAPIASALMEMLRIEDEEVEGAIKYSLVELLRNVVQHSKSRIGGLVSAVYFPKTGLVDVIVADIGCGLRSSLRNAYREINSDQKAVRFSLLPHVSGTFQSGAYHAMRDNAGLGLFFIKEIASRAGGGFFLASGDMLADIWGNKDGSLGKKYIQARNGGWRGTFALLQLRKDSIGEFGSLLAKCREIADEVRKNRTKFAIDFLDEKLEVEGLKTIKIKEFEEDVEVAASIRDSVIIPSLDSEELILLDFSGTRAATQSFIHALMYKIFRDGKNLESCLSVSCADSATAEAIKAVAAYAAVEGR
ncbi:hypothetical protein [Aeromonas sp. NJAU223]|uniref:hypothetical protein n=1 Tax=Aeromonas sp. NJAU223 TaxID=3115650 RepID=UPI003DAA28B3